MSGAEPTITPGQTPAIHLPNFEDLPLNPEHPPHSAWYLWGTSDQLGCLNHLTPERVTQAAREIRSGISVGLNWGLDQMRVPPFYRTKLVHEIFDIGTDINVRGKSLILRR